MRFDVAGKLGSTLATPAQKSTFQSPKNPALSLPQIPNQ